MSEFIKNISQSAGVLLKAAKDTNANVLKVILRDDNNDPISMVVAVVGKNECLAVLQAVEAAEAAQELETVSEAEYTRS